MPVCKIENLSPIVQEDRWIGLNGVIAAKIQAEKYGNGIVLRESELDRPSQPAHSRGPAGLVEGTLYG